MKKTIINDIKTNMFSINYLKDLSEFNYDDGIKCGINTLLMLKNYDDKVKCLNSLKFLINNRKVYEKYIAKNTNNYDEIPVDAINYEYQSLKDAENTFIVSNALGNKKDVSIFSLIYPDQIKKPYIYKKNKVMLEPNSKLSLIKKHGSYYIKDNENKGLYAKVFVEKYQDVFLIKNKYPISVFNNKNHILEYYSSTYMNSLCKNVNPSINECLALSLTNYLDTPKHRSINISTILKDGLSNELILLLAIAAIRR